MVSTRSGRVVSSEASAAPSTPGRGTSSTRGGRSGSGKGPMTIKSQAADVVASLSSPEKSRGQDVVGTGPALRDDQDAQPQTKLSERKVLLSPRRATQQTSPSPAPSPAGPPSAAQRMGSPASPVVAAWAAGSPGAKTAQQLSAVPLPDESDEDKQADKQQQQPTPVKPSTPAPAAAVQQPSLKPAGRRALSLPSVLAMLLVTLLLGGLTAAGTLTLCTPGALTPPLLAQLSAPPALQPLLLSLPSTPVCTHLQPASQLAQAQLSGLAPHFRKQVARLRAFLVAWQQQLQRLVAYAQRSISQLQGVLNFLDSTGLKADTPSLSSSSDSRPGSSGSSTPAAGEEPAVAPGSHHTQARLVLQAVVPQISATTARAVSPAAEAWEAAAADAASKQKALGVLLDCGSPDNCDAVAASMQHAAPACTAAVKLHGSAAGVDTAGQLQQQLTSLLSNSGAVACQGLVVVVRGLEAAPLAAATVLSNALSESGNLQAAGVAVPMQRAIFVFPVPLSPATPAPEADASPSSDGEGVGEAGSSSEGLDNVSQEEAAAAEAEANTENAPAAQVPPFSAWGSDPEAFVAFSRWAKAELLSRQSAAWAQEGQEAAQQQQETLLRAFRRRIDVVLQAQQ